MNKAFFVPILALALSCGKGTSTPSTDYTTGKNINTAWSVSTPTCNGDYQAGSNVYSEMTNAYVTIASGAITSCANVMQVTPPTFRVRQGTLPSGFLVSTSEGDVNATYQGVYSPYLVGFDFTLNGTSNFITNSLDNVSLTVPFDTSLAPGATSTNTFVRILNYDDNSLVDLHGTITSNSVVVKLYGLPTQFTVAVIYNSYMTDYGSAASSTASSSTWDARSWCTVYNWKNANLLASAVAMGYASTTSGVYAAVRDLVSNAAVTAENYYGTAGFRAPKLLVSSSTGDPCSGELGSTARYNIVINSPGPSFAYSTYGQVIRSENNVYGRIFIDPNRVDDLAASPLGSVLAAVAQEMFYPITDAYEVHSSATTKGIREGMATTYGMTIDNGNTITVRSASDAETKLMSDFVNVNERSNSDVVSHANQDLFAYLGRQYGSDQYNYVASMLENMRSWISGASTANKYSPPRGQLYDLMSTSFANSFGSTNTLQAVFLDFMDQRLFEHNNASQFGRSGETTTGFASNLMQTNTVDDTLNSLTEILVDASACTLNYSQGGFADIAPYAARGVNITPSNTAAGGKTITVSLVPGTGSIGSDWKGFNFMNNAVTGNVSATNTFSGFGQFMTDQAVVLFANVTGSYTQSFVDYTITCQ